MATALRVSRICGAWSGLFRTPRCARGAWYGEAEGCSGAGDALHVHRTAVALDDSLHDEQTEPRPAAGCLGGHPEAIEQVGYMVGGDASARVRHYVLDPGLETPARHAHHASVRRELDRVAHEIREDLRDAPPVSGDFGIITDPLVLEAQPLVRDEWLELDYGVVEQAGGAGEGGVHRERPRLDARDVEQILNERIGSRGRAPNKLQLLSLIHISEPTRQAEI